MVRRFGISMAAAVVVLAAVAGPAWATFPGRNGKIAYGNTSGQLSAVYADGTGKQQLTNFSGGLVEAPQYSADGRWIVFDADRHGHTDIFIMRSNGTQVRRITDDAAYQWGPSWSPDGRHIVYASDAAASPIKVINLDGTHAHAIGSAVGEYPRYSPNGNKIAYGADDGLIHVMNADGSNDHPVSSFGASSDYPDWSPNGRKIGYTSDESGQNEVWIMNADGSQQHQVTTTGISDFSPVFSPDGTRIAYWNGTAIYVSRLDGSQHHKVVNSDGCCMGWQPLP